MAIGMWYCEKCGKKTCGKCCESETDKEFLQRLKENRIKWTFDDLTTARRLTHIGLLKYETGLHSAWYEITEQGEKYLNT